MDTNLKCGYVLLLVVLTVFLAESALCQIYVDDTLFVGNSDGSPIHVPYQGVVEIPLWLNIIYENSTGVVILTTSNFAVSERLDGNLYYPWQYTFYPPIWYQDYSTQALWITVENPPDSVGHFADFTIRMALDASYINDTLEILSASTQFSDSTGYIVYFYEVCESRLVIDDITFIEGIVPKPENILVSSAYPNPFNSSTTIEYSLLEGRYIQIDIFDLLGRRIETLIDEYKQAGTYTVAFDASGLASGVYYYRLQTGNSVETKKMILLK